MTDIPEVLFVCTHNAGRSQMAAALLARDAAGHVRVRSAGSQPAAELNPAVVLRPSPGTDGIRGGPGLSFGGPRVRASENTGRTGIWRRSLHTGVRRPPAEGGS